MTERRRSLPEGEIDHNAEVVGGERVPGFDVQDAMVVDPPARGDQDGVEGAQADPVELEGCCADGFAGQRRAVRQPGLGEEPAAEGAWRGVEVAGEEDSIVGVAGSDLGQEDARRRLAGPLDARQSRRPRREMRVVEAQDPAGVSL